MPRFILGTTDHDGDGHMGGSNKGDDAMARRATKVSGATAGEMQSIEAVLNDTTTGADTPDAKPTLPEKQNAAADQFANADAKGEPELSPDEARMSIAVRGY